MKAFVTGASGFIGHALATRLAAEGFELQAPTRGEVDLLAPLAEEMIAPGTDVLVHCAAARDWSAKTDDAFVREIAMNVDATARLYEAARRRGVRAIVHLSTLSVLRLGEDAAVDLPADAQLVTPPTHPYALTKRWGEELAASLRSGFDAVAITRPGMTYGPGMQPSSGMSRVFARVKTRAPYALAAPDGHRYAPAYIDDVIDALAYLCRAPSNVTVNLSGEPVWERDLVTDMAGWAGIDLEITEQVGERAMSVVPSVASLDALLPGRTRTPWRVGGRRAFSRA